MTEEHQIGDGPIEPAYFAKMNALAALIDDILNDLEENISDADRKAKRTTGFVLMVFPFGNHNGRCNYISTADRDDVKVLLKEQLARFSGAPDQTGRA